MKKVAGYFTVTLHFTLAFPALIVITAVPFAFAVSFPFAAADTTFAFEDV